MQASCEGLQCLSRTCHSTYVIKVAKQVSIELKYHLLNQIASFTFVSSITPLDESLPEEKNRAGEKR